MAEALGLTLPGAAAIPAVDSRKKAACTAFREADRRDGQRGSQIIGDPHQGSLENAIVGNSAIGGSTNFVIHLMAIAGRIGINLTLDDRGLDRQAAYRCWST